MTAHQPDTADADLARRVMEAAGKATAGPWHWVNPDTDEPCQPGEMGSDLRTVEEFGEDKTVERDGKTYTTWRLPKWILASVEFRHDAEANAAFIALSRTAAPALAQAVLEKDAEIERLKGVVNSVEGNIVAMRDAITHPHGQRAHFIDSQDQIRVEALDAALEEIFQARTALKDKTDER